MLRHSFDLILSTQTIHENRIYSLKIICGPQYPLVRPDVQFQSRINLPFVSPIDGKVDYNELNVLRDWTREDSIERVLVDIRKFVVFLFYEIFLYRFIRAMASPSNKKLPQPAEGSHF